MSDGKLKSLRIQTGVVQRLNNELRYYSNEADSLKTKYERLRASRDEACKQSFEVWQDAQKVLPQVVLQLQLAAKELQLILSKEFSGVDVSASAEAAPPELAAVLLARAQLQRAEEAVPALAEAAQPPSSDQEY